MADSKDERDSQSLDRDAIIAKTRKMAGGVDRRDLKSPQHTPTRETLKTKFSTLEAYESIQTQRAVAEMMDIENPFFQLHEGCAGALTMIDGKEYINFNGYDYLGLNGNDFVGDAAKKAIDRYGVSVSASRIIGGERPIHRELETQIASLYEAQAALVFVSGHATNVTTIGELLGPNDLVLFDVRSHNSISVGTKLSGAAKRSYPHNDLDALEVLLQENRHRFDRAMIIVEGLYSMDGDVANLPRLIALKKQYDVWLMVDEAHSLGVLGDTGRGVFEHWGVDPNEIDIWMGTMSKTLCGCGGYIAGSAVLIDILKYTSSGFVFSVGMPAALAAAASQSIELMLQEPERVKRLQDNGQMFLKKAKQAGLDTGESLGFSIIPIVVGDSLRAVKLSNLIMQRGVLSSPVTFPAVPMREARLRFFITSEHTESQIDKAIEVTKQELEKLVQENFGLQDSVDGG